MQKYIEATALYEHAVRLETKALEVVQKLKAKHFAQMGADDITAWKVWTCILNERTAFKQDIIDAPAADVVERKKGKWYDVGSLSCRCSECGCKSEKASSFCPNCGAIMLVEDNGI